MTQTFSNYLDSVVGQDFNFWLNSPVLNGRYEVPGKILLSEDDYIVVLVDSNIKMYIKKNAISALTYL